MTSTPSRAGSGYGRYLIFFKDELNDSNTAWEIYAIARGGTPASDQMSDRDRRAEILKIIEGEIDLGAESVRTSLPPESDTVKVARINRTAAIWAAAITALAGIVVAYFKGWLSGK